MFFFSTISDNRTLNLDQEKTSRSERTDVTYTESQLKRSGMADPVAEVKGTKGFTSHPSSSPDPLHHDLTWSIREEVERLMEDQKSSYISSQTGKVKKQLVRQTSNFPLFQ